MKKTKITVRFRRRREQKTDYKNRLTLLKSGKPRLVVRKSLQNVYAQIIEYHPEGDKVLLSANSLELKKMGLIYGGNVPSAYLVGYLMAKKAEKNKLNGETIIDLGFNPAIKNTRIFAVIKGALDGGLNLVVSDKINKKLPSEEKLTGKEISQHASSCEDKIKFGNYTKNKVDAKQMEKHFAEIKSKIDNM